MLKNILIIFLSILIICAIIWGARFFIGGNEDTWLCQNGEWVKHGNPSASKPIAPCGEKPKEEIETMKVKVYFNNNKLDPEISCNKVFAVEREIAKTSATARAAMEELLKGATEAEKEQGFFSSINPGVKIQKLTIGNGVAKIDFDEQMERAVGGSCRVSAIRAQITQTLKQFPTVKQVIISVNSRTEDILQP